jgi:hypothetical protein
MEEINDLRSTLDAKGEECERLQSKLDELNVEYSTAQTVRFLHPACLLLKESKD